MYDTKNCFGTTKGESEAQHNNHKKSFTHCTYEKATYYYYSKTYRT